MACQSSTPLAAAAAAAEPPLRAVNAKASARNAAGTMAARSSAACTLPCAAAPTMQASASGPATASSTMLAASTSCNPNSGCTMVASLSCLWWKLSSHRLVMRVSALATWSKQEVEETSALVSWAVAASGGTAGCPDSRQPSTWRGSASASCVTSTREGVLPGRSTLLNLWGRGSGAGSGSRSDVGGAWRLHLGASKGIGIDENQQGWSWTQPAVACIGAPGGGQLQVLWGCACQTGSAFTHAPVLSSLQAEHLV